MKNRLNSWPGGMALLAVALLATGSTLAREAATREWRFDVSLDGRQIGEHRFVLRNSGDSRELTSEARFRVRVLTFDVYRYDHRARETWRGECLERLDASTTTNGKHTVVSGESHGGEFRLATGSAEPLPAACVQTFAYWNPSILEARHLLNPQTGEYVPVQVRELGTDITAGQPAERFRLEGGGSTPLEIDLWYTPTREWLALESRTPEGRRLRYSRK